jgi:ATP-dependent exoDNAse (exonuclease V) alpha subunit
MAIYHLTVKHFSREPGHKAVAAAAYRSGQKLRDERYEMTHDYTPRKGVMHTEILAPESVPAWATDREKLWNEVEKIEKRRDAQLAMECEVALPRELTPEARIELVRSFAEEEFVKRGMIADISVHESRSSDGASNPHAHIMLTTREVGADGFGKKARAWREKENLLLYREGWARHCNQVLEAAGEPERVDHRTLDAQGILREPTKHLGKEASAIARNGEQSARAEEQISPVDRELNPFKEQLHERGMVDMYSIRGPEASWWDRTAEFVQQSAARVRGWYEAARQSLQRWRGGEDEGGQTPEQVPRR